MPISVVCISGYDMWEICGLWKIGSFLLHKMDPFIKTIITDNLFFLNWENNFEKKSTLLWSKVYTRSHHEGIGYISKKRGGD